MKIPSRRQWLALSVVTLTYFLAGQVGGSLAALHHDFSAVRPATGIAIAAVLLGGQRMWPAVFLGACLVNLTTSGSVLLALNIAAGNTAEALLAGVLVERFANGNRCFESSRGVLQFLVAGAIVPAAASALVGAFSLVALGFVPGGQTPVIVATWWLGDIAGALLVTPFPLLLARWRQAPATRRPRRHLLESVLVFLGFMFAGAITFTPLETATDDHFLMTLLILPVILWSAFRLSRLETAGGILLVSVFAIAGTHQGVGPFARFEPNTAILLSQAFMATSALIGLVAAAEIHDRRQAEETLRHREQQHAVVVESAHDAIITVGANGRITFANAAAEQLFGYTAAELENLELMDLLPPVTGAARWSDFVNAPDGSARMAPLQARERPGRHRDGHMVPLEVTYGKHAGPDRQFTCVLRDITQRLQADALERWLATIVADSNDAILSKDLDGNVLSWNHGAEELFGYSADEMIGQSIARLYPDDRLDEHLAIMERLRGGERINHFDTQRRRKDGTLIDISLATSPITDATGRVVGASSVARDITERRQMEAQVRHLAHHDGLTGLINRMKLRDDLAAQLETARQTGRQLALLFIDLDEFKQINDAYGHECGDQLLKCVAQRLEHCVRAGDLVARLGGEECVVLLIDGISLTTADRIGRQLLEAVRAPVQLTDREVQIDASIGIALFPENGADERTLMIAADRAMYEAKRFGRDRCHLAGAEPALDPAAGANAPPEKYDRRAQPSSKRLHPRGSDRPNGRSSAAVPLE